MYVVDHIKRTSEEKGDKRQGQPLGQLAARRGGNITHGRGGRHREDKDEVSVDRLIRIARLGTPICSAGYRGRWT